MNISSSPIISSDHDRRSFLKGSAKLFGGAALLGSPLLAACGSDDDAEPATTSGDTAAPDGTTAPSDTTAPAAPLDIGTVRTAFNWQVDVEWSSWYMADSMGMFAKRGITSPFVHGGPNTPAVAQVIAAGDADIGVASDELQLIKANAEGADFVILGAMYQSSPSGYVWLADTDISTAEDLVGKKIGLTAGDELRVDAVFKVNGLEPDYETIAMSFDPQPLIDGDADVITCYTTNQPIQLTLQDIPNVSMTFSQFGLKAYGDVLFASRSYVEENRDLLVQYFAALLEGVEANRADPMAVIPLLTDVYGQDIEVDTDYAGAGNPAYIALLDSDFTEANGLLSIDPDFMENEVFPSYEAAGETALPPVAELLDLSVIADAQTA